MNIAINARPKKLWGGGSHFIRALVESLLASGHTVRYDLRKKVDAIIVVFRSSKAAFGLNSIIRYRKKHPSTVILQRINNLDTHNNKGSFKQYRRYAQYCHGTIYVSNWAKSYTNNEKGLSLPNEYVIPNAVHSEYRKMGPAWNGKYPLRIVIHHWSTNPMKGFHTYRALGAAVSSDKYLKSKFNIMYIGRLQKKLPGITYKKALHGHRLVEKLGAQNVYFTASKFECGPYHVLEAIAAGLPVIYGPDGGAIKEYVGDCGIRFDPKLLLTKSLKRMAQSYSEYFAAVVARNKNENIELLGKRYVQVIRNILDKKRK